MNQFGGRLAGFCAVVIAIFTLILSGCGGGGTAPARTDSGNSSGGNPTKTPTSNTAPAPHTLTVQASPATGGRLSSNPAGISCGSTCSGSFVSGTNVAITVSPAAGFIFTGWGGSCSGTGGCVVSMNNDQNVVANFGPAPKPQSNLSIAVNGSGSGTVTSAPAGINCGATCTAAFNQGSAVVLTPVAAAGSAFAGWSGAACTGTANCSLTLTADTSVTATFIPTYSLTTSKAGTGSGTISSSPAGVSCGATCSANFPAGAVISLAATPASGSAFTGWGGACAGTGACSVTLNSNQTVTANFGPPPTQQFNLSVSKAGTGSGTISSGPAGINCGAACTSAFNSGTVVTLTAAASAGSAFAGWSGAACAGTGTCTVTVTADTAVAANFVPLVPVTVSLAGTGTGSVASLPAGIACGSTCTASFASGSVVSLVASPTAGSVFSSWGGACSGSGACQVTLASAQAVTATFDPAPPAQEALTVILTGSGSGSVSSSPAGISCGATCTASFNQSATVTLTPSANAGSTFNGWSGACSGTGGCTVTMNAAASVGADFIPTSFPVNVTLTGTGSGTVTGNGINCPGTCSASLATSTVVTLNAAPQAGSVFSGWTGACTGTAACTFTQGTAASSVTATFAPQFTLTVNTTGTGSGTVTSADTNINCPGTCNHTYNSGDAVVLTATPSSSASVFAGWSGACSGTGTCSMTMSAAQTVTANFIPASFPINVTLAGAGSGTVTSSPAGISCGATCSANFNTTTAVTLTATPSSSASVFAGWSGACSGTSTCAITVGTSAVAVTATFAPAPQSTLTITNTGTGTGSVSSSPAGISCGATCSANFVDGTSVTLTATPAAGSVFSGWSGGICAGTGTCSVSVNANTSVTANFVQQVTLTTSLSGSGSGTITSSPAGINCGSTCSTTYASATSVTLAATPAAGSVFAGWSGACSGTGACSVTLNSPQTVSAAFNPAPPPQFTVSVTTSGAGTVTSSPSGVNCGATCSVKFNSGTSVTLTASPAAGSTFAGWSGSACAGTGTCTINVTSDTSVAANFLTLYTLGVTLAGTGSGSVASSPAGINCGATCSSTFSSGSTVSLAANSAAGSIFSGWSGACSGTGSCVVSMGSNQGVTATFDPAPPPKYLLTTTLAGTGSGSVSSTDGSINCGGNCSATYVSGTTVTLNATAATGSAFGGWSSAFCAGTSACTITIAGTASVTGNFVPVQPVYASVSGASAGGVVVSNPPGINCPPQCAANFNQGTSVTLTAVAGSGFGFNGWTGACTGSATTCTITINGSLTVDADFTTVKGVASPFLSASPSPFDFGSVQNSTTSTQPVTIANTGPSNGGNLIISAAYVDNALFSIPTGQLPMTIAPGSSQSLSLSFSPNANGNVTGTVTFNSNASNPTATLFVTGNSSITTTAAGGLNVSPNTLFFGNVNLGNTITQMLTMSNPGAGSTTITAATVSGSGFSIVSPSFPLILAPGTAQVVTIAFSPLNSGAVTGVLTFTSNASGSTPVVSVVANGAGADAVTSATVLPNNVNFGAVPIGATLFQNVAVYNTGNTSLTVNSATISGAGFNVSGPFPFTLAVNGSQVITVAFTASSAGSSSGVLTVNTTAPDPQPTTNVTAIAVFPSAHSATLSWAASPSTVTGYNIYRSTTPGTGYQLLGFVTGTTFTDQNILSGQTYYWVVTAVASTGSESVYSNQVTATIP